MSDATLRQALREAQRAGLLGVLSPGAQECLVALSKVAKATSHDRESAAFELFGHLVEDDGTTALGSSKLKNSLDWRELGAFLAQLGELL